MNKMQLARVVAGCVLQQDGKYLLVQEKQQKVYGLWNLPAGHVDEGETFEEAAIREVFEETGLKVELGEKISVEHPAIDRPVLHAFKAKVVGGQFSPDLDEVLDAKWLSLDEIKELQAQGKLRTDWVLRTIERSQTQSNRS